MTSRRVDLWAGAAAVLAAVMIGVYLAVIGRQGGDAASWYVALLAVGAAAAAYGAVTAVPLRRPSLVLAGTVLLAAGVLGILTIGLPILLAGVLSLVGARGAPPTPGRAASS